ncbi:molybdenum ABC transporter ATP-binding protein [Muricoccus radiodurans]|uniref:molybdenum ABC transporter ATP-binding protein n=1 Tax=Muricoccus radiodurans TaxID=2231721 RepID=UPI003CF0CA03
MLEVAVGHRFARDSAGFALDARFAAPTPGVTALFGPSGCGKSTTLAAIAGLLRPDSGRIVLEGDVLLDTARGVALPPERRRLGVVFQDARLFPHLSVAGNLRYGARRAPRDATGSSEEEVVALLGIGHLLSRRPRDLSGGERQRVALGRALLARPRLLLMDEPLASLDAARRAEVLPFLARLRDAARVPILYVTHALEEVDALADTLVLMEAGRVLAAGPVDGIAARPDLPLAARRDGGVLLPCTVAAHDAALGLTRLAFPGGALEVPLRGEPRGAAIRVRVRARDVSVATRRPEELSARNILSATVTRAAEVPGLPHEALVVLAVGPTTFLARVTRESLNRLGLEPGRSVWAIVKGAALALPSQEAGR